MSWRHGSRTPAFHTTLLLPIIVMLRLAYALFFFSFHIVTSIVDACYHYPDFVAYLLRSLLVALYFVEFFARFTPYLLLICYA